VTVAVRRRSGALRFVAVIVPLPGAAALPLPAIAHPFSRDCPDEDRPGLAATSIL
jgi:hypothetical protein